MTKEQEDALYMKLELLKTQALIIVQSASPYRSGDLSKSFGVRIVEDGFEIYQNETMANYMVYTEEAWLHPRWRGRANPNEAWFKETAEFVAKYIAQSLGGQNVSNT
jgi:hypothetical protein